MCIRDSYYYSLANEMGVDLIHDFMKPLGFGQITGIDLGGEVRGVLPSTCLLYTSRCV